MSNLATLGMLEATGLTPAMVALDVMAKSSNVEVLQAEVNDFLGIIIKITGPQADVEDALQAGLVVAERMGGKPVADVINRPDAEAWKAIVSAREYNPLIQQDVVVWPNYEPAAQTKGQQQMNTNAHPDALGFIETQGFTAVFEAIDTACKAANVEVVGKEKLGGGYVTVIIKGDVAAVEAAVAAGQTKVEALGNLIAAHIVSRPSPHVLSLLPQ